MLNIEKINQTFSTLIINSRCDSANFLFFYVFVGWLNVEDWTNSIATLASELYNVYSGKEADKLENVT